MAIKSQYSGKCKDCGTSYNIGEEIDTNGNKSPNKTGEMKDHWCKMGKNCQGLMQFTTPRTDEIVPPVSKDPTPEQFLVLGESMLTDIEDPDTRANYTQGVIDRTQKKVAEVLIQRSVIEKAMNELGLKHPGRVSFTEEVLK